MSASACTVSELPSNADAAAAREAKDFLSSRLGSRTAVEVKTSNGPSQQSHRIPAGAAMLLVQILDEMSRGNAVRVVAVHSELTTQRAADLLNVSRPTLIHLLDEGKIHFRKVGKHRRVSAESLLEYKQRLKAERLAALEELVAYDQELGL